MSQPVHVQIPKGVFVSLIGALVACLMLIAFLLGRESGRPATASASPSAGLAPAYSAGAPAEMVPQPLSVENLPPQVPTPPPSRPEAPPPPVYQPPTPPPVAAPPPVTAPPPPVARPQPTRPRPAPASSAGSAQIRNYLAQVDSITASTGSLGDPNQLANSVLSQGAEGNSAGFDDLISKTRSALGRLRQIKPPASCRQHYQLSLRQLEASLTLLQRLKTATVSGDMGALSALSTQGQSMQQQAQQLEQLTERLRQQAGGG